MNIPRSLLSVAFAAAFSATLLAQQAPSGYHSVACIKVKPENASEFRKWAAEDAARVCPGQSRLRRSLHLVPVAVCNTSGYFDGV